jgi:hypothetical protein
MPAPLRRESGPARLAFLLLAAASPLFLHAQLTTGLVEGVLRGPDGRAKSATQIAIAGSLQFRALTQTNTDGEFTVVLPYGEYLFAIGDGAHTVSVVVEPLETRHVDLVIDASGVLHEEVRSRSPGVWSAAAGDRSLPEATTLQGLLLNQEPASVTEPLDFTALRDNRVGLESQRGYSWTDTQYKLLGMDATDSYQPGRPVIVPDVQAVDAVLRSDFAQTASTSYGTEVGIFLAQPGASWHGALATADTGGFLSSSNLPPPGERGMVQQADRFSWFTRDSIEAGGPITKWADLFVMGAAQWSQQTVPLAAPGNNQHSRLLWGDARSRIRAGARDQFDALYSGSRINLNNWAIPDDLEALVGRRMSPPFNLPGGYDGQTSVSHFDFLQAGWTHRFSEDRRLGVLQMRYGYSTAHIDADPPPGALGESTVDLVTGAVSGGSPMFTRSIRTRQGVEGTWQPAALTTLESRHQILVGAGWKTSSPRNRITIPNNVNLITVNGAPAEVVEFRTPDDSRSIIRSFESYAADHVRLAARLSLDLGILADLSRGSIPAQGNSQFVNPQLSVAQADLIAWNSFSPRAGFAWQLPHIERLVLRGGYFRLYSPLAGRYLDFGNPNSLNGSVYQWVDRNSDGQFEPGEEGALLTRFGGAYSSISPSLRRPYADEFNLGAEFTLAPGTFAGIHLFRRDDKQRIAAIDTGVPASAYTPVTIIDPGPDDIIGTFDDRPLVIFDQNPATLGQDRYLLTNPADLRTESTGFVAQVGSQWRTLLVHLSFAAEKTYGPANPGNAVFENDPGVVGALYMDPNTTVYAPDRSFTDRAYVGKMQASYRAPSAWGGIEFGSTVTYMDGLLFRRQLLITGLNQGPFLLPVGDNRAQYAADWNLRILRAFRLPHGKIQAAADIFNVINAGRKIQENDISGIAFNLRLPTAIQEPRQVRLQLRYEF